MSTKKGLKLMVHKLDILYSTDIITLVDTVQNMILLYLYLDAFV